MKKLIKVVGAIFITLFIGGFALGTGNLAPDYAIVFGDPETNLYISPPCLMGSDFQSSKEALLIFAYSNGLEYGSVSKLSKKGFKPHPDCINAGGFYEEGRSLSGSILERLGILPEVKARWNSDGTWNN